MKLIIGSPSDLRPDPILDYKENDAWGNMIKMANWRVEQAVTYDGKKVIDIPAYDWKAFKMSGKQAYIVNCFYFAPQNSIFIPLAYLQKPFIDLEERGIEYNLAYIGYTIGHELCHALDDLGSYFDGNGNMNDWLTKKDRRQYDKIISDVKFQYETVFKSDEIEIEIDVMNNINENLADIGGLSLV